MGERLAATVSLLLFLSRCLVRHANIILLERSFSTPAFSRRSEIHLLTVLAVSLLSTVSTDSTWTRAGSPPGNTFFNGFIIFIVLLIILFFVVARGPS